MKSNAPRQVATRTASLSVRQAALELAQAQEAQAEKNLSYAKIVAPGHGIVAKKAIAVGDHVAPGPAARRHRADRRLLGHRQLPRDAARTACTPASRRRIHVDALGATLTGTVESIGGATGSRLSVLPPENASGNYVKVVQRIPVRIQLRPGPGGALDRLRIGMSVEPQVTVR